MINERSVTDCHSHFLPALDDGSSSVEKTLEILTNSKERGIDAIIATPHFYATKSYPEIFLKERERSFQKIKGLYTPETAPKIYLASEVAYYPHISISRELPNLCLLGTNYVFIEMPFVRWDEEVLRDIIDIQNALRLNVILVHVDRYFGLGFEKYAERLLANGVIFQWNAEAFTGKMKKKALKYYLNGYVYLLGSDLHNLTDRKQNLDEAVKILIEANPHAYDRVCSYSAKILKYAYVF